MRLEWSGAEYRGRARQSVWDGTAAVAGRPRSIEGSATDQLSQSGSSAAAVPRPNAVAWSSITTGNFAGVDLFLSRRGRDSIRVETPHATVERFLSTLSAIPLVTDCGKLSRQLRLSRPAESLDVRSVQVDRRIVLRRGDNPLYVCLTLADGHQAWSSPIYLCRDA